MLRQPQPSHADALGLGWSTTISALPGGSGNSTCTALLPARVPVVITSCDLAPLTQPKLTAAYHWHEEPAPGIRRLMCRCCGLCFDSGARVAFGNDTATPNNSVRSSESTGPPSGRRITLRWHPIVRYARSFLALGRRGYTTIHLVPAGRRAHDPSNLSERAAAQRPAALPL